MTLEQLRAAIQRALRGHGVTVNADVFDELVSIADHHAAEEAAAGARDAA